MIQMGKKENMNTGLKALVTGLGLSILASISHANTLYECNREYLSTNGFTNRMAADSWFPKEQWVIFAENKAGTIYGEQKDWPESQKKHGIVNVTAQGQFIRIQIKEPSISNSKTIMTVSMHSPGYKRTNPTRYTCTCLLYTSDAADE